MSFYPRASLGIGVESQDEKSAGAENSNSQSYVWVGLYAPVLVHPASHVFAGLGPSVTRDLTRNVSFPNNAQGVQNQSTSVGVGLLVGAWL